MIVAGCSILSKSLNGRLFCCLSVSHCKIIYVYRFTTTNKGTNISGNILSRHSTRTSSTYTTTQLWLPCPTQIHQICRNAPDWFSSRLLTFFWKCHCFTETTERMKASTLVTPLKKDEPLTFNSSKTMSFCSCIHV